MPDFSQTNALLQITDLHVDFASREGVVRAASGVSFDVPSSETLGLVGESGSGKSVTAQAILRIIPHPGRITAGRIVLQRGARNVAERYVDIASLDEHGAEITDIRRHDISLIMQEPMSSLSPVHTVGNQIVEKILLREKMTKKEAREQAVELLDKVGIPNARSRLDAYTFELSGGMRQRAVIAMALAGKPSLLIADEPTTAVDVTIQAQIIRLLRHLQDELDMAILVITHDLGVVANLAHRVAVMYRGRIVELGTVEKVFQSPLHPYTRGLIESVPDLADPVGERIKTIPGVVPHPFAVVSGCQFHPRCPRMIPGVCDSEVPVQTEPEPGHKVSCFLYQEAR